MELFQLTKSVNSSSSDKTDSKGKMLQIIDHGFCVLFNAGEVSEDKLMLDESNAKIYSYVIMPRLGKNLDTIFRKRNFEFTKEQIYSLVIQLVNILE